MAGRTKPLPGMEDDAVEAIRDAALSYVDVRDRRMALTKEEVEKQQALLDVMHEHKKRRYHDPENDFLVEVTKTSAEKVKVLSHPGKEEDVKDAIDGVTPGEDESISTKTMKRSSKKKSSDDGGDEDDE